MKRLLMAALLAGLAAPAAVADIRQGRALAKSCVQCHAFKAGAPDKFGPSLNGIFGRGVGSVEGYPYSAAMKSASWQWTEETLDAFIASPKAYLPGSQMPFPGLPDAEDRADLIAYLKRATR